MHTINCLLFVWMLQWSFYFKVSSNRLWIIIQFRLMVQNAQGFITDQDMALEELFAVNAEKSSQYNTCLSTMASRIATVFASLRVRMSNSCESDFWNYVCNSSQRLSCLMWCIVYVKVYVLKKDMQFYGETVVVNLGYLIAVCGTRSHVIWSI